MDRDDNLPEAEDELGSMEPEAFQLKPENFAKPADFVKSFIRATRKMHFSDVRND